MKAVVSVNLSRIGGTAVSSLYSSVNFFVTQRYTEDFTELHGESFLQLLQSSPSGAILW